MSATKHEYSPGLAGVPAGYTSISTVGKEGYGLMYRGYSITDLAAKCVFEEVAYLLLHGRLPSAGELAAYKERLREFRELPRSVRQALETVPKTAHPMDVMRTGCSVLGTVRPEGDGSEGSMTTTDVLDSLIASFGSVLLYWYQFHEHGRRIATLGHRDDTIASHFVRLLNGGADPDPLHVRTVDASLILYAEHGFAASTFACRVTTSTRADAYSAICTAIGTLRGPLHGGANEAAMRLIEKFSSPDQAESGIDEMLRSKQLIMGFGHRVYRKCDPRSDIIKGCSKRLSEAPGGKPELFAISERIEQTMWNRKKLFPNLDFYAASAYHQCGIPTDFFTPIFVIARTAGWGAHILEQRAARKLIRPAGIYNGPDLRPFVEVRDRKPAPRRSRL